LHLGLFTCSLAATAEIYSVDIIHVAVRDPLIASEMLAGTHLIFDEFDVLTWLQIMWLLTAPGNFCRLLFQRLTQRMSKMTVTTLMRRTVWLTALKVRILLISEAVYDMIKFKRFEDGVTSQD